RSSTPGRSTRSGCSSLHCCSVAATRATRWRARASSRSPTRCAPRRSSASAWPRTCSSPRGSRSGRPVFTGLVADLGTVASVDRVDDETFDVSLIPETLARTTLGEADVGRQVNLEVDVMPKYVEKLVGQRV